MPFDVTKYIAISFDNSYESSQFQQFLFRYGFGYGEKSFMTTILDVDKVVVNLLQKTIYNYDVNNENHTTLTVHPAFSASLLIKNRCGLVFNCESFFNKLEK